MKPFTIAGPALLCWLAGWSMVGGQEKAEAALQVSAGGHDRDWHKCKKCRPAVEKVIAYLKENYKKQDKWYDGALGNFYAGFAFLIEGNSLKELDDCCKKARYFIEKPPGYNQWIVGMSTLFLCEVSLKHGLTRENREAIVKAVQFFEKTQEATGGWHHGNNDYYTKDIAMVGTIVYAALVEAKALGIETGSFVDRARKYLDDICGESFGYSSGGKDGDVSSGRGSYTLLALLGTRQFDDPLVRKLSRAVERRYMNCANGHANGALHYFGVAVAAHRLGPEMYLKYAGEYIDKVLAVAQPDGSVGSFPHDCPKEKEAAAYEEMRTKDNPGYETRFCATAVLACMLMLQEEGCFMPKDPKAEKKKDIAEAKPVAKPAAKPSLKPIESEVAAWKEKLKTRLAEQLANGLKPSCTVMGTDAVITAMATNGDLSVNMKTGGQLTVTWKQVGPGEGLSLARGMLREGNSGDHALVAYYLLLNNQREMAEPHLSRAGAESETVRTAFSLAESKPGG